MATLLPTRTQIFAHRGFSSRHPEMTLAAYQEAIAWSVEQDVPLGLECDVQLTADHQVVCLHDLTLDRTSNGSGPVAQWRLADLRRLDFGSWRLRHPTPAQRALVTLDQLLDLVRMARADGADVTLAIETKHADDGGLELEARVCRLLAERGWDNSFSPVRLITFSLPAAQHLAAVVPEVERTLLIERDLGPYASGILPEGLSVAGVDIRLLRRNLDLVARAQEQGNEVHAWTVNEPDDIALCSALGVTGFTSDHPDRVLGVLGREHADHGVIPFGRRAPAPQLTAA